MSKLQPKSCPSGVFRVQVLGPFTLRYGDVIVDTSGWQRRMGMLFRLLVSAPAHRKTRDEIMEALWPEADTEAGARNLRVVLHMLRRALGGEPSPLVSEHGWIALNPDYEWDIDLERFEALTHRGDLESLEEAAALYLGGALPEDRYEDWARGTRERVERMWRDLCLNLARHHEQAGSTGRAISWLEQWLEQDPLDEEAVQQHLRLLVAAGRRAEAVKRLNQFGERLQAELNMEPTPETRAMVTQQTPVAPTPVPQEAGPLFPAPVTTRYPLPAGGQLVGRGAEMRHLLRELLRVVPPTSADTARLLLITGESGMGKTRLLSEIARRARAIGMLVLAGGSYEHEGRLPYGPIHDALSDYVRAQTSALLQQQLAGILPDLARILPELGPLIPGSAIHSPMEESDQRLRLFTSVGEALHRISEHIPLALLLDDLHWADHSTVQMVHFLLRQPGLGHVLLVGAYRQEEVTETAPVVQVAQDTARNGMTTLLTLEPLSVSDLGLLLQDRGGRCSASLLQAIHARSGGNPVFAVQTLRLLQQEEKLRDSPEGWQLVQGATIDTPPEVRETVVRRLKHLSLETREVLTLGAVFGREFPFNGLASLWEGSERSLFAALGHALDARLIWERGTRYVFRHPLLREVMYDLLPQARRPLLHARAGLALEQLYSQHIREHVAELALHFAAAGTEYREQAFDYLVAAAEAAQRASADGESVTLYERAVEFAPEQREAEMRERLGEQLAGMDRVDEAIEHFRRGAEGYRRRRDNDGEQRAIVAAASVQGIQAFRRGQWNQARARLELAIHRGEHLLPARSVALALVTLGRLSAAEGRMDAAKAALTACATLSGELQDGNLVVAATAYLARTAIREDDAERAARALEPFMPDYRYSPIAASALARVLLECGQIEHAEVVARHGMTETNGSRADQVEVRLAGAAILSQREIWDDAGRAIEEARALLTGRGWRYLEAHVHHADGTLLGRQGRSEGAREQLDLARKLFTEIGAPGDVGIVEQAIRDLLA